MALSIYVFGVLGGSRSPRSCSRSPMQRSPAATGERRGGATIYICAYYIIIMIIIIYIYIIGYDPRRTKSSCEIITSSHTTTIIMIFHPDSRISDFARNLRQKYVYIIIIIERIFIHAPSSTSAMYH